LGIFNAQSADMTGVLDMAWLKYYLTERADFPEAARRHLTTNREAGIVFKKLVRHFKVDKSVYYKTRLLFGRGNHAGWHVTIRLPTDFLVLCHEIAHVKHIREFERDKRTGKIPREAKVRWHGRRHYKLMRSMVHYCEKKGWFEAELQRRTMPKAPKLPKPEPTKDGLRLKKIERRKAQIKRYDMKIKRLIKAKKKAQRSLGALERAARQETGSEVRDGGSGAVVVQDFAATDAERAAPDKIPA